MTGSEDPTKRARIEQQLALLDFPEMGALIPEEDAPGAQRGYRRIIITPYSVFYRVLDDRQYYILKD